jgi:enamine deaminase RidA (YjgF/YER057c/UK114 family)
MQTNRLEGDESGIENVVALRTGVSVQRPDFVITERMRAGEPLTGVFQRVSEQLAASEAALLSLMIYGSIAARESIEAAMRTTLGETNWPITWIEGGSCDGLPLAGVQVFAVSGRPVTRVRLGRLIVGSVYEDGGARYCLLGGLGPTARTTLRSAQVQQTLGNLEWALDNAGFTLGDVMRTWFYNDDILAWYDEFNRVRTAHYSGVKWRTGSLPASTGIGARNPAGGALVVAAWAMQPLDGDARATEIGSPLQCPAPQYGSAFSRAMEVTSAGWRRLLISGTASIHPDGRTAWVGNPKKQVDLTMEVISAILCARGMDFNDVTRATAYFEHPLFKDYFDAWCAKRDLEGMPVVSIHADVCRSDLLFELELDAYKAGR